MATMGLASPSCSSRPLVADELTLVAGRSALAAHRRIVLHRRGYGASSPARPDQSIADDADDCRHVIRALGLGAAHVVGVSYAGAVALQLAADHPGLVHTLTVIEPPPLQVAAADEFRAANVELLKSCDNAGPAVALDTFRTFLSGPDWRASIDARIPGAAEQAERDAVTFFDVDVPALLSWRYSAADAARVVCPVLHVGGTDSGPWFALVRDKMQTWFPQAGDVVIEGADHNLALTHPEPIAEALADFFAQHP